MFVLNTKMCSSNTKRTNVYVINIVQFPSVHKTKFKKKQSYKTCAAILVHQIHSIDLYEIFAIIYLNEYFDN